jgi:hypothetical protein
MYYIFLCILLVILILIMATKSRTKRRMNRKTFQRKKKHHKERIQKNNEAIQYLETFNIEQINPEFIKECNDELVKNEKKCNCFVDKKGKIPSKKYKKCIKMKNTSKCSKYNKCKNKFASFMSGYEPKYDPDNWNDPVIENSHNCYAYFLDDHIPEIKKRCKKSCNGSNCNNSNCGDYKPQPSDCAYERGLVKKRNRQYSCNKMETAVLKDNTDSLTKKENVIKLNRDDNKGFTYQCPPKYYKGALVVDPNHTYHFYRQDNNVRFSHKQGTLPIENVDASKKPIYAPHLSDLNYNKKKKKNGINYTRFCSYMCVPRNSHLNTCAL